MVNKDKTLDISDGYCPQSYDKRKKDMTENDLLLMDELIKEVNQAGYHIQYYFQLSWMKLEDRELFPIIKKYIGKFDNWNYTDQLLIYIGVPKLYEATEFLLDVFENPDPYEGKYAEIIRETASSSLLNIKDKRYTERYKELILNPELHRYSNLLVQTLGAFKTDENYEFIKKLLNDDDPTIRSSAIKTLGKFRKKAQELVPIFKEIAEHSDCDAAREYARKGVKSLSKYL